ncbi:MAG: hypothetical protein DMF26_00790 [Verrucomicrobia bacterium]|nr:MAG: hypothetical protein DMF26_00790 [Verrucomicrobiota bacterium]
MKKEPAPSNTRPRENRSNVVPLKGEIDLHVSPTVTAALNDVIDKKPERLVVDLSDVSYIDSAGLATLIQAMQKSRDSIRSFRFSRTRMPRWQANPIGKIHLGQRHYSATRVRISSVCATFFEMSNCDARSILTDRTLSRRERSDQKRIASRKAIRLPASSTIDPWTPSSMISPNPLERVVITGNPLASASRHALEKGS